LAASVATSLGYRVMRWTAAGLLEAEKKKFQKVQGYRKQEM
jgi:hypothetical protein